MPWPFLVWLLSFVFQAAVLGCSMYQLVQLTDLETDHINPHEAAKNFNSVVVREDDCCVWNRVISV